MLELTCLSLRQVLPPQSEDARFCKSNATGTTPSQEIQRDHALPPTHPPTMSMKRYPGCEAVVDET